MIHKNKNEELNDELETFNMDDFFGNMNNNENNSDFPKNPSMYAIKNEANTNDNNENHNDGNQDKTNSVNNTNHLIAFDDFP